MMYRSLLGVFCVQQIGSPQHLDDPEMAGRLKQIASSKPRTITEDNLIREALRLYLDQQEDLIGSGRPYIEITKTGKHRANYNTLASVFHNWTYAGWVTSTKNNVPPKTIRGNWEALVTTEELERGLAILHTRNQKRSPHRTHEYLLRGLVYYQEPEIADETRLTCSTVNSSRVNGGTPYYRIAGRKVRFLCRDIDRQILVQLLRIQVDTELLPIIRNVYTSDIAEKMGHLRPDERQELAAA